MLFEVSGAALAAATQALQAAILDLLVLMPPGMARFVLVDPVGRGHNVAPLIQLTDHEDSLVIGGRVWAEPQDIEEQLVALSKHADTVIHKYLRQYESLEEYNADAGEITEPYRFLVVLNFPMGFSEAAAQRLSSIAQSGPTCGIYPLILVDSGRRLPYDFTMEDIRRATTSITWNGERFVLQRPELCHYHLDLGTPPDVDLYDKVVRAVGIATQKASVVKVPFARIAPERTDWWSGTTNRAISIPLGPSLTHTPQLLDLGTGTNHHVLIGGQTGSGKTNLLHVIITMLAVTYSPSEIELYLVDLKEGVEFKIYAEHRLPHARVVAVHGEREFGLSVLEGLETELQRRADLFREVVVKDIVAYRAEAGGKLPRIALVIDEFHKLFAEDDDVSLQSARILNYLVREGRAFGIHVLLASQTLAGVHSVMSGTIGEMSVRIALLCGEEASRLVLADDNPDARLLSRRGEAIYNASNGRPGKNSIFQAAWLSDKERTIYLDGISRLARKADYTPPHPQIVFEGNVPASAERSEALNALIDSRVDPQSNGAPQALLGDPVSIRNVVASSFSRQSGANLLIVGRNAELAMGMTVTSILSLLPWLHSHEETSVHIVDCSTSSSSYSTLLRRIAERLSCSVAWMQRRRLQSVLRRLAGEVRRRIDEVDRVSHSPRFLVIYGLQRARDLDQDDLVAYGPEASVQHPTQDLLTILRDGPEVGIHTITWCDTLGNFSRRCDRTTIREFAIRVGLQMSADDSSELLDTAYAKKLGRLRALYYDEEFGELVKFSPYMPPSAEWLDWALRRLE